MSAPELKRFLDGGTPQPKTLGKLQRWGVVHAPPDQVTADVAEGALALFLVTIVEPRRWRVRKEILEAIGNAHRMAGSEPPAWYPELLAHTPPRHEDDPGAEESRGASDRS